MNTLRPPTRPAGRQPYPEPEHVEVPEVAMPTHDQIAALAYQLWMENGQSSDGAEQNWFEAEQRLMELVEESQDRTAANSERMANAR